jgi:WD40 repeat protein
MNIYNLIFIYDRHLLRTLLGHGYDVRLVAFDAYDMLVSGSGDDTIKIWNKNSGDLLRTITGNSYTVRSIAFDANDMIVTGSNIDSTIKLWKKQI